MTKPDKSTVKSVARVFNKIKNNEHDSDHVSMMNSAINRLWVLYDNDMIDVDPNDVDKQDVQKTVDFLDKYAPSRKEMYSYKANNNGERHPNRMLNHMFEFVDLESRYFNGCLPSYRNWTVEYIYEGEVIDKRSYDYDDEIPRNPTINDIRYEHKSHNYKDSDVTITVSKNLILINLIFE